MDADLELVFKNYIAAWNALDFEGLQSFWDTNEPDIYYLAEEMEHPFYKLEDVVAYWEHVQLIISWITITPSGVHQKMLSEHLAVLTYSMHVDMGTAGPEKFGHKPLGVDVRVSAILRKTNEGWRFIHYAESPLGALPFIRRAYHANVKNRP